MLIGGVDFKDLKLVLKKATLDKPEVSLNYGQFINTLLDFLIVAFAIFIMVKALNTLRRKTQVTK